jgi:hypothetical protein
MVHYVILWNPKFSPHPPLCNVDDWIECFMVLLINTYTYDCAGMISTPINSPYESPHMIATP